MTPSSARKVATNVSLRAGLVARAKALDINLSALLEQALEAEVLRRERAAWLEENRDAIEDYNRRITPRGTFGDRVRRF